MARKHIMAQIPERYHETAAVIEFGKAFGGVADAQNSKSPMGGKPLAIDPCHVAMLLDAPHGEQKWEPAYHVVVAADLLVAAARTLDRIHPKGDLLVKIYDSDYPISLFKDGSPYAVLLAPRIDGRQSPEPLKAEHREREVTAAREEIKRLQKMVDAYGARIADLSRINMHAERYAQSPTTDNLLTLAKAAETLKKPAEPEVA